MMFLYFISFIFLIIKNLKSPSQKLLSSERRHLGGYPRGVCRSLQTTFFLWFLDSKACRLPKNGPEACIPKCIFLYPKPADLIFEMPKPADQIFFRGKARFLNKYLKAPIKHIILFTSHIFPQQTNYIFNPSFIDPYLKVEQSLHFYGENCKACRLLF